MSPITAGSVLFGDAGPVRAAARSPGWRALAGRLRGALGAGIPAAGLRVVESQLSSQLSALLSLDVAHLILDAWRARAELNAAARATQHDPGASTVVPLADHRVLASHRPSIDVVVNGTQVATLDFALGVMVDVESVSATVRHGQLVEIHSGRCTVGVGFRFGGFDIAARTTVLDPAVTIRLSRPIPLLRDDRGRAAR